MKQSRDVPKTDCLDVCDLIPGMTREPWDEVPITLLAYAGYYGRQDMIDYLIQEGASKKGYICSVQFGNMCNLKIALCNYEYQPQFNALKS